jgi:hypothetical protein
LFNDFSALKVLGHSIHSPFFCQEKWAWDRNFPKPGPPILILTQKVFISENILPPRSSPKVMKPLPMIICQPSFKLKRGLDFAAVSIYNFNKIKKIDREWSSFLKLAEF